MRYKLKGSFTIEATLILPIVIIVIFSLICLSFYLHDCLRIKAIADQAVHEASLTIKHDADYVTGRVDYEHINDRGVFYLPLGSTAKEENAIENYLKEQLSKGLFLTKIENIKVTAGKFKITVTVEGNPRIPLKAIRDYLVPGNLEIIVEGPVHSPAETIRLSEVILETGAKLKGFSELKDKINNILH